MTVSELIKELQDHPGNMVVLVDGYESGYDAIGKIFVAKAKRNKNGPAYEGEYYESSEPRIKSALMISRRDKSTGKK